MYMHASFSYIFWRAATNPRQLYNRVRIKMVKYVKIKLFRIKYKSKWKEHNENLEINIAGLGWCHIKVYFSKMLNNFLNMV